MFLPVFLRQGVFQCLLHLAPRASAAIGDLAHDDLRSVVMHAGDKIGASSFTV